MTRAEIPDWLIWARDHIAGNMENAGGAFSGEPSRPENPSAEFYEGWDVGYWGGYYDACRHALKALPPYVKFPDPDDWRSEGFEAPQEPAPNEEAGR